MSFTTDVTAERGVLLSSTAEKCSDLGCALLSHFGNSLVCALLGEAERNMAEGMSGATKGDQAANAFERAKQTVGPAPADCPESL